MVAAAQRRLPFCSLFTTSCDGHACLLLFVNVLPPWRPTVRHQFSALSPSGTSRRAFLFDVSIPIPMLISR